MLFRFLLQESGKEHALAKAQIQLAQLVGVSRNTIRAIGTGKFTPTAKLALILCIAVEKKSEDLLYFQARPGG